MKDIYPTPFVPTPAPGEEPEPAKASGPPKLDPSVRSLLMAVAVMSAVAPKWIEGVVEEALP